MVSTKLYFTERVALFSAFVMDEVKVCRFFLMPFGKLLKIGEGYNIGRKMYCPLFSMQLLKLTRFSIIIILIVIIHLN